MKAAKNPKRVPLCGDNNLKKHIQSEPRNKGLCITIYSAFSPSSFICRRTVPGSTPNCGRRPSRRMPFPAAPVPVLPWKPCAIGSSATAEAALTHCSRNPALIVAYPALCHQWLPIV